MKNFQKRLAGLSLGLALTLGVGVCLNGVHHEAVKSDAADAPAYTLGFEYKEYDDTKKWHDYTSEQVTTSNGIEWTVTGNQTLKSNDVGKDVLGIGGKNIDTIDRYVYSNAAVEHDVTKIEISLTKVSTDLTINSMTLTLHSTLEDAKNNTNATVTRDLGTDIGTGTEAKIITVTKATTEDWNSKYYRFTFNVTNTNTKNNYRFEFNNAVFYKTYTDHYVSITGGDSVEINKTLALSAVCAQEDAITWSIDQETIATIDASTGLVTGVAAGEATVTATCASSTSATLKITVYAAAPTPITGKTITEVNDLDQDYTKIYEITGYVSAWIGSNDDATKYGNFYLKDSSVSSGNGLYVYGATATKETLSWNGEKFTFNNPKDFLTNETTKAVTLGSRITIYGFRLDFNSTKEFQGIVTKVTSNAEQATEFATAFLDATETICLDKGATSHKTELEGVWSTLEAEFNKLSPEAQDIVKKSTYETTDTKLAKAVELYDHIVNRYALNNFVNRTSTASSLVHTLTTTDNNLTITIIVLISVLSVSLIVGTSLIVRKRKVN